MGLLYSADIHVGDVAKKISVYHDDVTIFQEQIDVLTTSAYVGWYNPTPKTIFHALMKQGISAEKLAESPQIDLRDPCHIWLSREITSEGSNIKRLGCIELLGKHLTGLEDFEREHTMINSIRAYFHMLDMASVYDVDVTTVTLPLPGGGSQRIPENLLLPPLINECITFLKRNQGVRNIYFIEKNPEKAERIATYMKNSLHLSRLGTFEITEKKSPTAFISYSSKDKNIADNLCSKLENHGIKVWYSPRDVKGPYADAIVEAIDRCGYFIVILSQNSLHSDHVLNEVDLAFQNLSRGVKFKPLRIDDALFTPSFKYYLSRQHWMDATHPPLEERLNEFVASILKENEQ